MIKILSSLQNPEVKAITALHQSKGRYEQQRFIAQGNRVIATFLENNYELDTLYITEIHQQEAASLAPEFKTTVVTDAVMGKISTVSTPSGMLAIFKMPSTKMPTSFDSGLVLSQINDPGNMGTLIRSCAAMGYKNVIIVQGCDPWSPKVIQASAGTIALVSIIQCSWEELIAKKGSTKLCALVVKDGYKPEDLDLKKSLLVVGNEAQGLPEAWIGQCEQKMTIPMPGNTESLNAAVAGSIALYLCCNQQKN